MCRFAQTTQTRCPNTGNGSEKTEECGLKGFFEEEEKSKSRHRYTSDSPRSH
jgi:hypothetical protein